MGNEWNGSQCISQGSIQFASPTFRTGEALKGSIRIKKGLANSYGLCMETPANQGNCANGANFTPLSTNTDWKLTTSSTYDEYTLRSDFIIASSYPTGKYTGYIGILQNGSVKDPYRTARRSEFTVAPGSAQDSTLPPANTGLHSPDPRTAATPSISFRIVGKTLHGDIYTTSPDNTWVCMDSPMSRTCSDRSTWVKAPAPGWGRSTDGYALQGINISSYPNGVYTGYAAIGQNGPVGNGGTSSFTVAN